MAKTSLFYMAPVLNLRGNSEVFLKTMWRRGILWTLLFLFWGGVLHGKELPFFRVIGAEVVLGDEVEVPIFFDSPEGVRALEGVLVLEGAEGRITTFRSAYEIQTIEQSPRSLRFRWLDSNNEVGPRVANLILLTVTIVPESPGKIRVKLSVPFFVTDAGIASRVKVESGVLEIKDNVRLTAVVDEASTEEDTPVSIAVLANDRFQEGRLDPYSLKVTTLPEHGMVIVDFTTGQIIYTPDVDFSGADSFSYRICDVEGTCDEAAVTVYVESVNDPPQAGDDLTEVEAGKQVIIDVLSNDTDVDGDLDPSSLEIVTSPSHGNVELQEDGTVLYIPDRDFVGIDTFQYTVKDDAGAISNIAKVVVKVEEKAMHLFSLEEGQCMVGQLGKLELHLNPGRSGIQRLEFTVEVPDPDFAEIVGLKWEGLPNGLWEVRQYRDGLWKTRVADPLGYLDPGHEGICLLIYLDTKATGTGKLILSSVRGLNDRGEDLSLTEISFSFRCVLDSLEPEWGPPQDLDGDGKYEDLNGDGRFTLYDVLVLSFYFDRPPLNLMPEVVDFDGDGALTFADVEALASFILETRSIK